ncbi:MAG: hybrid sensor histidine kinase/response regulator [Blastocatellia bacterium]|nr:hybrid sensor histidine kinase/response regulator [Blastocatellia bacterium]
MTETTLNTGDILLVDDNPINLDLLSGMLFERKYRVRVATNGKRALAAVRSCLPDLILLDINMPDMDGYEVCRTLKADETTREVPVIFISALDEAMDKVRAFEVGGVDYVTKPFQFEEVLARIENQLKISRLQKEMAFKNEELANANLKLKELDRIKANFAAMLVHDLKSPLSVIKGTLELFSYEESLDTTLKDLVTTSERSVDKMLNLINEALDVFRNEAQDVTLEVKSINPETLLRGVAEEARLAALSARITVETNIEPKLPSLLADPDKLERVFANLLSNAIKFTPQGGRISLDAKTVSGTGVESGLTFVQVSLTDTGEGIPADTLPYIFEPYRQARSQRSALGVGLGLAIVKRIIAEHGGNISVRSQLGVGTCFTVMLPAKPA